MSKLQIPFDIEKHHIYLEFEIRDTAGVARYGLGILDTGAPRTEFSDIFLNHTGFLDNCISTQIMPQGQETMKYRYINLPFVTICGYQFINSEFIVSSFERSWGIDALIGLDLFRKCRITIDYGNSIIISESY